MPVQLKIPTNSKAKLCLQTREERIIAFFFHVVSGVDGFSDKVGDDLASNVDEKTFAGEISGSAQALRKFLDLFCLAAVDIALEFSKEDLSIGVERNEILRLFDGLDHRVPEGEGVELSIYDMMSEEQRLSVREAVFRLGKQLPRIFQYDELPELSST